MKDSRLKFALELFVPVLILVIYYLVADPFMFVRHNKPFHPIHGVTFEDRNRDFVSACTFDNYNDSVHYNSFILGNSRSRYYLVEDWKKHLDSDAVCLHFDASNETLNGILLKLRYADKKAKIQNVLLVLDTFILSEANSNYNSYIFHPAPQTTEENDWVRFQLNGFKTFCAPKFLFAYTDLLLFGEVRQYMKNWKVFTLDVRDYNVISNESTFPDKEKQIQNGTYYDSNKMKKWFKRINTQETIAPQCIHELQLQKLSEISQILHQKGINYKVIISPGYDQEKLNPKDFIILNDLFGQQNVFDFSGKNGITENYQNYYDISHYRPHVTSYILDSIYNE